VQRVLENRNISPRVSSACPAALGGPRAAVAVWLVVMSVSVLAVGCRNVATTWTSEATSPDGRWVASARSQQWGGPGTAYDATTVYLKDVESSRAPTQIILFSHQYATMNLNMQWITPAHLVVTYGPNSKPGDRVAVEFQAAKVEGVDISIQQQSGEAAGGSH